MAWKETTATAWGDIEFKIGTPSADNGMSTSLDSIGTVKEDSIGVETQDGTTKEWRAVNGKLIDELKGEPILKVKCFVKNLNKSNLGKFWNVSENATTGELEVKGLTNANKYSISFGSNVKESEEFKAPYCSVSMKPAFDEKEGWGQEIEFTLLSPGEGKALFNISQVA